MAKINSGRLILTKSERKNLILLMEHTKVDLSYGEGGTYNYENKKGESDFDAKEAKKVEDALETIEFILNITK